MISEFKHEIDSFESASFRLLNSEIGNDQTKTKHLISAKKCFRLLNSEIGNDQLLR